MIKMKHKEFMDFLESKRNHWLKIQYNHAEEYILINSFEPDYNQTFGEYEYSHNKCELSYPETRYEYTISGPGIYLRYYKNIKEFSFKEKRRVYSSQQYEILNPIEFKKIYDEKFNRELLCPNEWNGNKVMTRLNNGINTTKNLITKLQNDIVKLKIEVKVNDSFRSYVEIKQKRRQMKCHENNLRTLKRYKKKCNQLFGQGWPSLSKCHDMNCIERMNRENWEFNNKNHKK